MTTYRYENTGDTGFIDDVRIGQVSGSRTATLQFYATRPTFPETQTVSDNKVIDEARDKAITREILFSATMDLQTLAVIHARIGKALEPLQRSAETTKKKPRKSHLRAVKNEEAK